MVESKKNQKKFDALSVSITIPTHPRRRFLLHSTQLTKIFFWIDRSFSFKKAVLWQICSNINKATGPGANFTNDLTQIFKSFYNFKA